MYKAVNQYMNYDSMSKNQKAKKTNLKQVKKIFEEKHPEKNFILVFGGVLLAISSIGLLIFVVTEKVFQLS